MKKRTKHANRERSITNEQLRLVRGGSTSAQVGIAAITGAIQEVCRLTLEDMVDGYGD